MSDVIYRPYRPKEGEFWDFTTKVIGVAEMKHLGGTSALVLGIKGGPSVEVSRSTAAKLSHAIRRVTDYDVESSSIRINGVTIIVSPSNMPGYECFWLSFNGARMHLSSEQLGILSSFLDEFFDNGCEKLESSPGISFAPCYYGGTLPLNIVSDYQLTS